MNRAMIACLFACLALSWTPAMAQSNDNPFQVAAHYASVTSDNFDGTNVGFGARFSWHPTALIGAEAEMTFYSEDMVDRGVAFSRGRVEGLFGVTVGPVIERIRPFVKFRPGFVNFQEAPGPIACLTIFPPPLACRLAGGEKVLAYDIGGGVEVFPSARILVRVDASDRMVRYPAPVLDTDGTVHDTPFFGHDFRFTIGVGARF